MRKSWLILFVCFSCLLSPKARGQEAAAADSLKQALAKATTTEEKAARLDELSRVMMNVNPVAAEEYGKQLIVLAEESRDRKIMYDAYLSNGVRCSYMAGQKKYSDLAIGFFTKAMELARQNRMEKRVGRAQLHLASIYLVIPDKDKALTYATNAFSLLSNLPDDSLRAEAHNVLGAVYQARNENTLALRNFLSALRIADELDNPSLIRNCYTQLAGFYSEIEDYETAIDKMNNALAELDRIKEKNAPYQRVVFLNTIGNLFSQKKNYDIAISYYERSIALADSLHFSTLKIPGYISLLNQYLQIDEPEKALEYMQSPAGTQLKTYLSNFGLNAMIDQVYGVVYTKMGRYDSARFYMERARPVFEQNNNQMQQVIFLGQLAGLYRRSGENKKAIDGYLQVIAMSEKNGYLENIKKASQYLDTLYTREGDFTAAARYKSQYYVYKDSIESLKREKELAQVEADDEEQRQLKAEKEAEELKQRRNNIQYLAIVIGIAAFFVTLVILGMFKVSAGLIKALGFFVFIMLFEFIFLIFKKNIYSITHGEPWKDLLFMIALAALLVPLHHWLEHKVLHYLTSHNRLTAAGRHLRNKFLRRGKEAEL